MSDYRCGITGGDYRRQTGVQAKKRARKVSGDHLFLFETFERLLITSVFGETESLGHVGCPLHLTRSDTHLSHAAVIGR